MMRAFGLVVKGIGLLLFWISCALLVCIVFLTVLDVIMRRAGQPIDFAVEIVCMFAGIVVSFALPATSLNKGHVIMEFIEGRLPQNWLKATHIFGKCVGIAIFVTIGLSTLKLGNSLRRAGQCSPILEIPEFPLPYALSAACFVECLVLCYMLLHYLYPEENKYES
jgi:TRAP-type C4-dicarboxylate transport system permease small subunit